MNLAPRRQRGQALTEFLVVAVALIPLFLLIPFIGKYQDISHATQLASRYAAFDALTRNAAMGSWKPEAQLADEVRRRFYSNPDAAIKTYDVAGDFLANQNLFWRDPLNKPLVEKFSDVTVTFGHGAGTMHASGLSPANDGDLIPLPGVPGMPSLRSQAGLSPTGIYTADVSVKLIHLPSGIASLVPFDTIDLAMRRSTSVIFDPWAANGPAQAEARAAGMSPVDAQLGQEPIPTALGLGIQAVDFSLPRPPSPSLSGRVVPPQFGRLDKWRDVVPADRLRSGQ